MINDSFQLLQVRVRVLLKVFGVANSFDRQSLTYVCTWIYQLWVYTGTPALKESTTYYIAKPHSEPCMYL